MGAGYNTHILTHSEVKNYSDAGTTFVSLQVIDYSNYDNSATLG